MKHLVYKLFKPRILELNIRRSQSDFSIVFNFLLAAKKKSIIVSFRYDSTVLTDARILEAVAV